MKGVGSHEKTRQGETDVWLTPPHILKALGPFDLDPCVAFRMPWRVAVVELTELDDGLSVPWRMVVDDPGKAMVWLNPPYGPQVGKWLGKLLEERMDGLALIFARTETVTFQELVFERAHAVLFLAGRLNFCDREGRVGYSNAGAPSCIVAYGERALARLEASGLKGCLVKLK